MGDKHVVEFRSTDEHTAKDTGWFFGVALMGEGIVVDSDNETNLETVALHYKYGKYDSLDTAKKIAATFMFERYMVPFLMMPGMREGVKHMLHSVETLEMPDASVKLSVRSYDVPEEVGGETYFIANYIPENIPGEQTVYEMIADHSMCTEAGVCVHAEKAKENK